LSQGKLSSNINTTLVYYSLGFPHKVTYKKEMARQIPSSEETDEPNTKTT